ncbi:MAG TPA: class II aldolase/adducin family protein [Burkholderiales bacterium]|nr:class II aldolase/adducin family protein [Burkholderiales bacterium]
MSVAPIKKPKSVRDQVSPEEWAKRVDLAAAYRLVHLYGMDEMIANHISTRVPGEDGAFLINPYGMLYEQMHASCFVKLDYDGKILFNPTEYGINRAGFVIHSAIHRARHDVDCVIHTHTLAGMAVSAMKAGLMPIAQTAMRFIDIGYHDYEGVAIDMDEQARLVHDLGNREAMILRNHGLLVVGASIPEAFDNIFRLERACELQVTTLACNTELSLPPRPVVEAASHLYQPGVRRRLGLLEWPALLRKLDALDPSYRE